MNGFSSEEIKRRRDFAYAFNHTMVKIWKERISLLKAVDTGRLYRSVMEVSMKINSDATDAEFTQQHVEYGTYVNWGTGRETPKGNPGDIGREKRRIPKRWFDKKYYGSVMNIKEMMAESLGVQCMEIISDSLKR